MALYGAFSRHKHLEELASPIDSAAGVLTPAQRRQAVIDNLFGSSGLELPAGVTFNQVLSASDLRPTAGAATAVVEDHGDDVWHVTKVTCTAFSLGNVGDNASLGIGAKLLTLPAGVLMIENASLTGTFDADISSTASTPEIGLGTVVATGAVSVLGGTATFENIIEGATIADVDNEAYSVVDNPNGSTNSPLLITAAGSHDIFLNAAAAWADISAVAPLLFTGVVTVKWRKIS